MQPTSRQTVTFRRVETITLSLDVAQPLARETLATWANAGAFAGIASPMPGTLISHLVTDWTPVAATPAFTPGPEAKQTKRPANRRSGR